MTVYVLRMLRNKRIKIQILYPNGLAWETLTTNASDVCPDKVLPLLSTIVPEIFKHIDYVKQCILQPPNVHI